MNKLILLTLFLLPLLTFSQTQLGSDIDGEVASDNSGRYVSIDSDGSHVAIGAHLNDGTGSNAGHVRVYEYSSGSWSQVGNDIDGEAASDYSGISISIDSDGSHLAIGATGNDGNGSGSGHVRVYEYSSGSWSQVGNDIDGEAAGDSSGVSVSIDSDGSHVAIGAIGNDGTATNAGHVRIYSWDGSTWNQLGNDIDGEANEDQSGYSVSIDSDGSHVAIGAYKNGNYAGHVRIYEYSGGSWSQLGSDIDGEAESDRSGRSVSIDSDGSHVAIGAYYNDGNGSDSGHVRVYSWDGSAWNQLGNDIDGEAESDRSGTSVSIDSDGSHVAIGAYYNDGTASNAGHVRIYSWDGSAWTQVGSDIDGEAASDSSGYSVSIDSDGANVAIGAYGNDGTASNAGHVRIYDITPPVINSVSLATDNSTIAVTFSQAVYNTNAGSGALEVSDFTLSISGGAATLSSSTPSSISASGNVYTLGISLSGYPTGAETLTVVPSSATAIYDAAGIAASTSQSNNTVTLNDTTPPVINSVSLATDNSTIAVTFSEAVYNTNAGSGALEVSDFTLSISGGSATLSSSTPSSISASGNVYTLGISLSGYSTGAETLTVVPSSATAIYDAAGTAASTSQSNNTVTLNDTTPPVINSVSLATDNSTVAVTFSEAVYNTNAGSGALEVSDFTLSISGGSATLSSSTPSSISASGNVYTLGISLSGYPSGAETLTVVPSSATAIYDAAGTAASTSQSNNTVTLNDITPTFDSVRLSADNASVAVTASETLYTTTGGSGALVAADFALSISGGTATLSSTTPTSISTSGLVTTLGIGLSGTPDGDEILKLNPASATSIYDSGDTALSATSIMATTGPGLSLFPNTLTAASLTSSGATTAGSLTVDSVVIDGTTIGHSSDSDLMTLASGSLTVAGDITISSDARLKSNIVALGPTLISLLQLEAKSYTMKNDTEQKQKIGLLAQEVQKVFPELVSEDNNGMLAVNYQALVPVLINALKELESETSTLESQMSEFEKIIPVLIEQANQNKK